jgi:hypothetical protein
MYPYEKDLLQKRILRYEIQIREIKKDLRKLEAIYRKADARGDDLRNKRSELLSKRAATWQRLHPEGE